MRSLLVLTWFFVSIGHGYAASSSFSHERGVFCVLEGTQVLLANGQQKPIEQVDENDRVRNGLGNSTALLMKIVGPEKSQLFQIQLSSGKSVVATEEHPFITAEGYVLVSRELKVGMELKTVDGNDTITQISKVESKGNVYTLVLAEDALLKTARIEALPVEGRLVLDWRTLLRRREPFLGLSSREHTFYVNGILNGDGVVQGGIRN